MEPKHKSIKSEGLRKWVGDDYYLKFVALVDRGQRPTSLARDFKQTRATITKRLEVLAHERGLEDWHKLYN